MNNALVREAARNDLQGILALYAELRPSDPVLSPGDAAEHFDRFLANADVRLIVAQSRGAVVSSCMLAVVPNLASGARPFGIIEHVITAPTHRRHGFASAVLKFALTLAWTRNCYKVVLLSGAERTAAHRLYEAVGFHGGVEHGFVAKPAQKERTR